MFHSEILRKLRGIRIIFRYLKGDLSRHVSLVVSDAEMAISPEVPINNWLFVSRDIPNEREGSLEYKSYEGLEISRA